MPMNNVYSTNSVRCSFPCSIGYEMESMHIHDVFEIYMALSENVRFFVNNQMFSLECGDVILFTSSDLHKVSVPPQQDYRRCIITFDPQNLCRVIADGRRLLACFGYGQEFHRHFHLNQEQRQHFLTFAHALENCTAKTEYTDLEKWLNLGQILLMLCRMHRDFSAPAVISDSGALHHIRKILEYIDSHFREDISLDKLSSAFFLNKSYLCRLFKQETGFRIHDYIVYRRLSNALQLLRSGKSVGECAKESGFSSDTFFITVFRQQLGITPYQYAKNNRVSP